MSDDRCATAFAEPGGAARVAGALEQGTMAAEAPRPAAEGLVQENLGWLRGWFRARVQDPDRVDDLCQESFLKALEALPRLRDPARFPAWLYRIAMNTLQDHFRSRARNQARSQPVETLDDLPAPDGTVERAERREESESLLAAVRQLPEKLREPLVLRHTRGLSYREIAGILGIRENTVQVRIFRARELLRKRLPGMAER